MARGQELFYALVGLGDLAVEKVSTLPKLADKTSTQKAYDDMIKRGRTFSKKIRSAAATKRALEQSKTARTQIKAATTSVSKAVQANVEATRSIAQRVAKAS